MIVISIYVLVLLLGFEFDFPGVFISFLFSASGRKNKDVSDETVHLIFGLSHTHQRQEIVS